jgi:IS5 family transposase
MGQPCGNRQAELFGLFLGQVVNLRRPLMHPAAAIGGKFFARCLSADRARPGQPPAQMPLVPKLLPLMHRQNRSEAALCERWPENPYCCGERRCSAKKSK